MNVLDRFPPLQGAIAHAESWKTYLNACQEELGSQPAQDIIARAENNVGIGIQLGELLPITWSALFNAIFRPSLASWNSVKEFEAFRQQVRALFYTVREAMDSVRKTAEMLKAVTGRSPEGTDRLLVLIDDACRLEEAVFRDWPSFTEPLPSASPADSLPVDESLAEAFGITLEAARQKMDARRRELNTGRE